MEEIKCPICHHLKTKELFKIKENFKIDDRDFFIRKCLNCEIVFTFPVLSRIDVERFYPKYYFWKKEYKAEGLLIKLFRKLESKYSQFIVCGYDAKRLIKFIGKNGKLLDVGCGTGSRLEAFKKAGFSQCCGIEPMEEEALYAREVKKLQVQQATLEEFDCPENSFDIATLYNVWEHLDNPASRLKIIKKILRPGGWLVLQIPNFDSWESKLFKNKWLPLDPTRHYFHYTPETINNLLTQNGFAIKKIDWTANFMRPFSWVFSLSGTLPQKIWQKEDKRKGTLFYRIWWSILLLISIVPNTLETLFNHGSHMTIYAINQKNDDSINQSAKRI